MTAPLPCRWTSSTTPRVITDHHDAECKGTPCRGCQPCKEAHCRICGIAHEAVCGGCLTATRTDLSEIKAMYAQLPTEAECSHADGRVSTGPLGGEAMVMLAGWASPYAEIVNEPDLHREGELHPLHVLATWEDVWRDWTDNPTILRATVARSADYLDRNLHTSANATERLDQDGDLQFAPDYEQMVQEIRQVRSRLEDVLHAGDKPERVDTPCIDCDGVRLVKVYSAHLAYDGWKCPRCKRRYDERDYTNAVHQQMAEEGEDRYVKAQDARHAIGRPDGLWRKWLRFWYVRSYTDPVTRQVWVWWPDVREVDRHLKVHDALRKHLV